MILTAGVCNEKFQFVLTFGCVVIIEFLILIFSSLKNGSVSFDVDNTVSKINLNAFSV